VVVQDYDRAVLRRQAPEGPVECVTIGHGLGGIRSTRPVDRKLADLRAPSPVPARLLVTGIHEEPVEPNLEALGITEPRQVPPREEECLLDGVLCQLDAPEDPVGDRVAPAAEKVDELGKGSFIAAPRSLDHPRPHAFSPHGTRWIGRFTDHRWSKWSKGSTARRLTDYPANSRRIGRPSERQRCGLQPSWRGVFSLDPPAGEACARYPRPQFWGIVQMR
jgi:hypothetical protein